MNRILPSTSVRLALGYAAPFVVSSFVLVGFLWWQTADYLDREINAVIIADTRAIADRMRDFGLPGAVATINERVARAADEHTIYLLTDPGLNPIVGNLDAWPASVDRAPGWYQVDLVRGDKPYATRILNVGVTGGFRLLVGRDVQDRVAVRGLIVRGLAWAGLIAVILAVLGGVLVRRSVLRRIDAINRTTRAIVRGDLSQRVPSRESADEFDQLAKTINGMLGQIQILIDGIRNTSNAIAHDLRTPLTELRSRLEAILRRANLDSSLSAELGEAVKDVDRLQGIFNALLRLSEIDSGARREAFRTVDMTALVQDVIDLYEPIAEEKQQSLTFHAEPAAEVMGDPVLIAQAIGNLLDNAIKYTSPRGSIFVRIVHRSDGMLDVAICDSGPGIPASERQRIVQRFYRGDASRGTPGAGLGLSLVDAVARLHDGVLEFRDNQPGLIAALVLPLKSANRPTAA